MIVRQLWSWQSLPTRERGLKPFSTGAGKTYVRVAPHAGARIETHCRAHLR